MPKRILLADDSLTIQKVVELTFAQEQFEVVVAGDGDQAVLSLTQHVPDIVLADVVMPGKDGYEVCHHVKNDPKLKHIPVVLLAGAHEAFDEIKAQQVGADGHVLKPFTGNVLVQTVTDLLAAAAAPSPVVPVAAAPEPAPAAPVLAEPVVPTPAPVVPAPTPVLDAAPFAEAAPAIDPLSPAAEAIPVAPAVAPDAALAEPFGAALGGDDQTLDSAPIDPLGAAEPLAPMAEAAPEPPPDAPTMEPIAAVEPVTPVAAAEVVTPAAPVAVSAPETGAGTAAMPIQPAAEVAPVEAVAAPSGEADIALEDFPEEVLNAIVERVVKRMSDETVRDVAWQVVPELAELMIKRKLDELG